MPRKTPVQVRCQQCGQMFDCYDYRKNRSPKYCSRQCRDLAQTTRVTLVCVQCGREFQRKAYMKDWSKERGPFCGFDCYGCWQKENTVGPENPNYNADSVARDTWNWKHQRGLALERDGFRCRCCGSTKHLHVHHMGDPDNHELDNLETLCAPCHRKAHPLPHAPNGQFLATH